MKGPSFLNTLFLLSNCVLFSLSRIPLFHSCSLWENGSWMLGSRKGLWTCVLRRIPVLDLIQALITSKFSPHHALFSGASTYSLATPFPVPPMYWAHLWAVLLRVHLVVWGSIPNRNKKKERRPSMSCPSFLHLSTVPKKNPKKQKEKHWGPSKTLKPLKVSGSSKYTALKCANNWDACMSSLQSSADEYTTMALVIWFAKRKKHAEVRNVVMSKSCHFGCHSSTEPPQMGLWDFFSSIN